MINNGLAYSSFSKTGLCSLAAENSTHITDFPFKLAVSSSLTVTAIEDLSEYLRGEPGKIVVFAQEHKSMQYLEELGKSN